jgi:hypothetical protein
MTAQILIGVLDDASLPVLKSILAEFGFTTLTCAAPDLLGPPGVPVSMELVVAMARVNADPSDLTVVYCSFPLTTSFGYRVAGVSESSIIVISGRAESDLELTRVLRHELGHYFGLVEHLDCVMSPYYTTKVGFCGNCIDALGKKGVAWESSSHHC